MSTNTSDQSNAKLPDFDNGQCAICLGSHVDKAYPNCGHVFCFECLANWSRIKLECPTCRQPFTSFFHSYQSSLNDRQVYTPSTPIPLSPITFGAHLFGTSPAIRHFVLHDSFSVARFINGQAFENNDIGESLPLLRNWTTSFIAFILQPNVATIQLQD